MKSIKTVITPSNLSISLITKVILGIIAVIVAYLIVRFFMNTYESFETSSSSEEQKSVIVNLYSMVGCGHCDAFKPEWAKLIKTETLKDGTSIVYNNYSTEDSAGLAKIEEAGITGFPTITIKKPTDTTATQYTGPRTAEGILNFLNAPKTS